LGSFPAHEAYHRVKPRGKNLTKTEKLTAVLVVLKIIGVIAWGWWLVMLPYLLIYGWYLMALTGYILFGAVFVAVGIVWCAWLVIASVAITLYNLAAVPYRRYQERKQRREFSEQMATLYETRITKRG
jgi:hypothetical protein